MLHNVLPELILEGKIYNFFVIPSRVLSQEIIREEARICNYLAFPRDTHLQEDFSEKIDTKKLEELGFEFLVFMDYGSSGEFSTQLCGYRKYGTGWSPISGLNPNNDVCRRVGTGYVFLSSTS